jgi:very-short-patch-repair endonuclease
LRDYTKYAETGGNDLGAAAADKPELNAFEIDVRDRLVAVGMKLTPQFGVAVYFIDFVAYHPSDPNRPVLAFEADGASYQSSPTTRDRDRLRQQVLEGLGWTFHRIWSTEWFANPTVEVERALQSWELAIAASDDEAGAPSQRQARDDASTPESTTADLDLAPPRQSLPIRVVNGTQIGAYPMSELVQLIEWIESDGKLRVDDDLIAIASANLGYARKGAVIKKRLGEAISIVRRRNL